MIKHVEKQLNRKRVYSGSVCQGTVWKSKCQGIEASAHMASAIRNRAMNTCLCSSLCPLKWSMILAREWCRLNWHNRDNPKDISISQVILDSVKSTINTQTETRPTEQKQLLGRCGMLWISSSITGTQEYVDHHEARLVFSILGA